MQANSGRVCYIEMQCTIFVRQTLDFLLKNASILLEVIQNLYTN